MRFPLQLQTYNLKIEHLTTKIDSVMEGRMVSQDLLEIP